MCRWIAYIGTPIYIDTLVTKPSRSLVEQSLHAQQSFEANGSILSTNGDGFGLGWYMYKGSPGLFKTAEPAWANENINELCSQIHAHIFMAHIRSATAGSIQRTNAHPFKYENWLFQHNGYLHYFDVLRRELLFDIAPEYFPALKGTTDSEVLFLLALTFGLQNKPKQAIEKMIAHIRSVCQEHNVPFELVMSCSMSNGEYLYTFRFAEGTRPNSQYYSTHAECMKEINEDSESVPPSSVVVVSEPLDQSMDHWKEMPLNTFATIYKGQINIESLHVSS